MAVITGTNFDDVILPFGPPPNTTIFDDTVSGLKGNDTIVGDEGNDTLGGDQGNDVLYGDFFGGNVNGSSTEDDLLYGGASRRRKLWTDVIGILLFLFPSTLVMAWYAWPFFLASYRTGEMSSNAGGLPVWQVKFLLPFGLVLLLLQGVAELVKRIAGLLGVTEEMPEYERPLQ